MNHFNADRSRWWLRPYTDSNFPLQEFTCCFRNSTPLTSCLINSLLLYSHRTGFSNHIHSIIFRTYFSAAVFPFKIHCFSYGGNFPLYSALPKLSFINKKQLCSYIFFLIYASLKYIIHNAWHYFEFLSLLWCEDDLVETLSK